MSSRFEHFAGYAAGIAAGVSYGLNPLFAKPLLQKGVDVYSMLLFRYLIAAVILGFWMAFRREPVKVRASQVPWLVALGLFFSCSSIGLFESYNYIPAGLATTIVYLYPVFTALMMIALGRCPSWQTWTAIAATLCGMVMMCVPSGGLVLSIAGMALAAFSALSYAVYLVVVNNNRRISDVSPHTITLYALVTGTVLFMTVCLCRGVRVCGGISSVRDWACLLGLAVFPTMVSMLALAISTRSIGATRTAVLGVFEPVTAILVGLLCFGEHLTAGVVAGVAVCLAAVLFMIVSERKV